MVVGETVDLLERSLGVGAVLERDEAESLAETRFLVLADVDAANMSMSAHVTGRQRTNLRELRSRTQADDLETHRLIRPLWANRPNNSHISASLASSLKLVTRRVGYASLSPPRKPFIVSPGRVPPPERREGGTYLPPTVVPPGAPASVGRSEGGPLSAAEARERQPRLFNAEQVKRASLRRLDVD